MKKILILFLVSLTVLFSACSKEKPAKTTIKFSSWGSKSEVPILTNLINEFEQQNPNIKVEFIHIPQNYFQKLHLLFASNLEPDVVFINNIYAKTYIKADMLEDITPYFKNEISNNIFFDSAIKAFSSDGKTYAIPRDISNLVIYYNKNIFDKNKISYPKSDWTLNDLQTKALKTTTNNNFAINYEGDSLYWLYYLAANGGGILSDDTRKIIINSIKSKEGIRFYSSLSNNLHVAPTKAQKGSMTSAQMFIEGKLAMYLGGRWMVPKFRETLSFDWDIVNFPASKENKLPIDASGWALSKKSNNKKEAIQLIKFLSSKASITKITESGLIIPARKDVAYSNNFLSKTKKPEHSILFIDVLKYSKPTAVNSNYPQINDILNQELEPVFNGSKNVSNVFTPKLLKQLNELTE